MGKRATPSSQSTRRPSHWPDNVKYIASPQYAPHVHPTIRAQLQGKPTEGVLNSTVNSPVMIRKITTPTHPAFPQCGLFATKKILPNSFILFYAGEIHTDERPSSDYDLSLYKAQVVSPSTLSPSTPPAGAADSKTIEYVNIGIDAQHMGNEARFINDYRGTGVSRPNAMFKDIYSPEGHLSMSVWSGKEGIAKGDEILVSYGKGWWRARTEGDGDVAQTAEDTRDA